MVVTDKHTFVIPNRIGIYEYYFVFVPNVASGRKGRYTIYKIPPHEGRIRIVGRELPLGYAKKYIKILLEKSQFKAKQTIARLNRMRKDSEIELAY